MSTVYASSWVFSSSNWVRGKWIQRARIELDQRAGLNGIFAVGDDAVEHVRGVALAHLHHRVTRLAVLTAQRDDLRAVRIHREHLHVVDVFEVLPAGEADAAVVHREQRDDVGKILRTQLAIGIPTSWS
ncbi:MAG: hypothetical protein WDO74_11835 [Pseudomonadota bacterium]